MLITKLANTIPTPVPAPTNEIVAAPAPINFADLTNIVNKFNNRKLYIVKPYLNCSEWDSNSQILDPKSSAFIQI